MANFTFKTTGIELNIENNIFHIEAEDILTARANLETIMKEFEGLDINTDLNVLKEAFKHLIDAVLGSGAVDKIFSNLSMNLERMIQLAEFLNEEISSYTILKTNKYLND